MSYLHIDNRGKAITIDFDGRLKRWTLASPEQPVLEASQTHRLAPGVWRFDTRSDFIYLFSRNDENGEYGLHKVDRKTLEMQDWFSMPVDVVAVNELPHWNTDVFFSFGESGTWHYMLRQHPVVLEFADREFFEGVDKCYLENSLRCLDGKDEAFRKSVGIGGRRAVDIQLIVEDGQMCVFGLTSGVGGGDFFHFKLLQEKLSEDPDLDELENYREFRGGSIRFIPTDGLVSLNDNLDDSFCKMVVSPSQRHVSFTQFSHRSGDYGGWRFNIFVYDRHEEKMLWGKTVNEEVTGSQPSLAELDLYWPCSAPVFTEGESHIIVGTAQGQVVFFDCRSGAHKLVQTPYSERYDNLAIDPCTHALWHYQGEDDNLFCVLSDIREHLP